MKAQFRMRLSEEGISLLGELAKWHGLSPASVVEMLIRQTARDLGVRLAESASASEEEIYGFHPWMRQIAAYARPLEIDCPEGLAAEDVLQAVFDKSLRQQTVEDKRMAAGCLKRLGWISRDRAGVWVPPNAEVKQGAPSQG